MNINNNSNINQYSFSGAFKFKPMKPELYEELQRLVPVKSRVIYGKANKNGDIIMVSHSCYDNRVCSFIGSKNIEFEYYPKIKFSDKLTKDIACSLVKRDKVQNNLISNLFLLKSHILKENITRTKTSLNHIENIFKTLGLNVENPKIEIMKNGLPKIRDNAKERSIYLSGNYTSKYYVYIKPDSPNIPSSRYLLYGNGEIFVKEYKTPEEIKNFTKLSGIISD